MTWSSGNCTLKFRQRDKLWRNSTESCTAYIETKKGLEARSYRHWLFLTVIKGKIIFNDYSYSVSTRGHQREVRRLLKGKYKIDLIVDQYESLSKGINISQFYKSKFLSEIKLSKKGLRESTRKGLENNIIEQDKKLKTILKSKVTKDLSKAEKIELKKSILENENRRLERQRTENREIAEKRKSLKLYIEKIEPVNIESLDAELDNLNQINFEK